MSDIKTKSPHKKIDTAQVCRFLSKVFANATEHLGKNNVAGTELHKLQVDFCYFINEITRGNGFQTPKVIADCNTFIDNIVAKRNTTR